MLSLEDVPVVLASVDVLPESVVVPELDPDVSDCARLSMAEAKSPP